MSIQLQGNHRHRQASTILISVHSKIYLRQAQRSVLIHSRFYPLILFLLNFFLTSSGLKGTYLNFFFYSLLLLLIIFPFLIFFRLLICFAFQGLDLEGALVCPSHTEVFTCSVYPLLGVGGLLLCFHCLNARSLCEPWSCDNLVTRPNPLIFLYSLTLVLSPLVSRCPVSDLVSSAYIKSLLQACYFCQVCHVFSPYI